MPELYVQVKNKIAINSKPIVPVCDNNDYVIIFDFDEEWNSLKTKTARFIYNKNYTDVIFDDNKCPLPIIRNTNSFTVGVFAGDLHTTTPAYFRVNRSILSGTEAPAPPEESSVYNTIMKKLNQISEDVNRTNENIGSLSDLETESKDSLVAAINEAARSGGGAGGALPAVTATDAGKFLRVSSSGSWAAETVASASGGEF